MRTQDIVLSPYHIISKTIHKYREKRALRYLFNYSRKSRAELSPDYIAAGKKQMTDADYKKAKELWAERYEAFPEEWTDMFHCLYTGATGVFSENYIPDDLYYRVIDPYFNDWEKGEIMDNKCLYARYFPSAQAPYAVGYRMNGTWLDEAYHPLSEQSLRERLDREKEVIVKRATESMGGKGVYFLQGDALADQAIELVNAITGDVVIQRVIKQHEELSKLNSSSVNTIRHLSFLSEGKATVYSSILRMGVGDSRVDNASSGGITCGITEGGRLKSVAYFVSGERFERHPTTGLAFDSIVVPGFSESVKLVEDLHSSFPLFRLVSWDIAIDENGSPILIEANFYDGELDFHQLNNGPLFGDDQDKILSEVKWSLP